MKGNTLLKSKYNTNDAYIINDSHGMFVQSHIQPYIYTTNPQTAEKFPTKEAANEAAVEMNRALDFQHVAHHVFRAYKFEDNRKINYQPDTVHGHTDLVLIPGNQYNIRYGIHQGRHVYVGCRIDNNDLPVDCRYEHLFRPVGSDEITFSYYGHVLPYEFTRIVQPVNQ